MCRPPNASNLEVIRTDTPTFTALIESRRNRPEEFFKVAGRPHRFVQCADSGARAQRALGATPRTGEVPR